MSRRDRNLALVLLCKPWCYLLSSSSSSSLWALRVNYRHQNIVLLHTCVYIHNVSDVVFGNFRIPAQRWVSLTPAVMRSIVNAALRLCHCLCTTDGYPVGSLRFLSSLSCTDFVSVVLRFTVFVTIFRSNAEFSSIYSWLSSFLSSIINNKLCGRPPQYVPPPPASWGLTFCPVRVTCDVGYLCASFNLPRPLCSRLRPDVRDRQTDVRRASSLNSPTLGAGA